MTFGEQISTLRKGKNMTQEGLANALGVTNQAVSKWENGQSYPDITQLPNLADLFGVSIDYLFGREAPQPIPAPAAPQGLPWADDDAVHIAVYLGHRMVDRAQGVSISVELDGDAREVECWGSLHCDDVHGNVLAGGDVHCDDVSGSVTASGSVDCDDVAGNVSAGQGVNCGDVEGHVQAGGSVECGDVEGNLRAGGEVNCGDVEGSVQAGGEVNCGDVDGDVQSNADINCATIKGNAHAAGSIIC